MEPKTKETAPHDLILESRSRLTVTGVRRVIRCDPDGAALELVRRAWRKQPYRAALLIFDRSPGNPLYEPFAARLNRLPELAEAIRIDALPVEKSDGTAREHCRLLRLEESVARELRVVPHRVIWTPPAGPVQKKSGER